MLIRLTMLNRKLQSEIIEIPDNQKDYRIVLPAPISLQWREQGVLLAKKTIVYTFHNSYNYDIIDMKKVYIYELSE